MSRDELGDAVWGEDLPRTWETALRGAISQLRRAAAEVDPDGEALISTAFGCYQLDPGVEVDLVTAIADTEAAERLLADGDVAGARDLAEQAAATLGASLLPGLEGEWLDAQRRRLGPIQARAQLVLSAAATAGADHGRAVAAAAAAVDIDPFDEHAHRQLMTAHAAAGDRAAAMVAYRRCRELLADELGLTPSEQTEAVRRTLADAVAAPVVPVAAPRSLDTTFPLAGRHDELGTAVGAWRRAKETGGAIVALTGPAGAGKSRLAAELALVAHREGATVGHGRFDFDDLGAFGAISEVLGQFGVAWPPPEASGWVGADRQALFETARVALRASAGSNGLVVVLDDVHWADRPSLALLADLAAAPLPGVLVVLTSRDDWVPPSLAELLEAVECIGVGSLDPVGTGDLVAAWAGHRPAPGVVAQIQRRTAGNPFFITAVLQDLADRGRIDLATGVTELDGDDDVSGSVADLVTAAVGRCGQRGAEVALAAAVLGHEFRADLLPAVSEQGDGTVAAVLERLVHARVVGQAPQDPSRFRFVHALVRQSVLDGADPELLRHAHRRAAAALAVTAPGSSERLGHLLAARDDETLEDAVELGLVVADELVESGAPHESVAVLATLLDWLDAAGGTDRLRAAVLMSLANAEVSRDHLVEGRQALRRAAQIAVDAADPTLLRTGVVLLRPPTAAEHDPVAIEIATKLVGLAEPGSELDISARCWLAAEVGATEVARAGALAAQALGDARRLGSPLLLRLAALTWHLMARGWTDPAERRQVMEELLALPHSSGKRASDLSALVFLAGDCLELGDRRSADDAVERALLGSASYGATHIRWIALRNEVLTTVVDGDLDRADALLAEASALAASLPIPEAITMPVFQQVLTRYHQGRLDELQPLIASFEEMSPPGPITFVRAYVEAEVGAATVEASVDKAVELALTMDQSSIWTGLVAVAVEAAAAVGHPRTGEVAAMLAPRSGQHAVIVTIGYLGAIDRYLALGAAATGDVEAAADLFERAQAQHAAVHATCYLERTARDACRVLPTGP